MKRTPCRCKCGYTCGGPGVCQLGIDACLEAGHFVRDCDHVFNGPRIDISMNGGASGWSVTCSKCGMSACGHDCAVGP